MIISYNGLSSFKFAAKSGNGQEYFLVSDPFEPKQAGVQLPRLKSHIIISTDPTSPLHGNFAAVKPASENKQLIVTDPGEYEAYDIFVQGLSNEEGSILYYLEIEKLSIAFIGKLKSPKLAQNHLELLEDCDILILPVGGGDNLSAKQAGELTNQLEPRVVIPSHFKAPGIKVKKLTDTPEQFMKEIGIKGEEKLDKLRITPKDLPQEELRVVNLSF